MPKAPWVNIQTGDLSMPTTLNMPFGVGRFRNYDSGMGPPRYSTKRRLTRKLSHQVPSKYNSVQYFPQGPKGPVVFNKPTYLPTAKLGENVGSGTTKRFTSFDSNPTLFASRSLFVQEISFVRRNTGTAADSIDQRERDIINLRGIKICYEIENKRTVPLHFHFAILHSKNETVVDSTSFFRGTGASRGIDFSTALNSLDMHTRGINTDKYTVLRREKITLNPVQGADINKSLNSNGTSYGTNEFYQKIERQVRFAAAADDSPVSGRVFAVWWATEMNVDTGTVVTSGSYDLCLRAVVYYREPLSG